MWERFMSSRSRRLFGCRVFIEVVKCLTFFCVLMLATPLFGQLPQPPPPPTPLAAYRQWYRWPYQRIGVRAYMRSTYDRSGGNEAADASHFLFQLADDKNVTLDTLGPGVLYFVRTNHWHGSPWHYEVDGNDHIVKESSTANPDHPFPNSTFLPANLFPPPLGWQDPTSLRRS